MLVFPQGGLDLHDKYPYMSTPLVRYIDGTVQGYWFNIEDKNRVCVMPTMDIMREWLWETYGLFLSLSGCFFFRSGTGPVCDGFKCYVNNMKTGETTIFPDERQAKRLVETPEEAWIEGMLGALKIIKELKDKEI